jgi:GTP pyrophosphokinase
MQETVAKGREAVEKLLQREGKTAIKLVDLAVQLGFKSADDLFEVVGKDEFSLRTIEAFFKPPVPELSPEELLLKRAKVDKTPKGGVLVVGVDSLLTQLAKCCKPAPGDAIGGFVTRGKGVSIHRSNCPNFQALVARNAAEDEGRVIEVAWANQKQTSQSVYPVDVVIEAVDHQGLLREILEVFSKDKLNVIAANTQSVRSSQGDIAWMTFTVEVADSARLSKVLGAMTDVQGVRSARRR